MRTARTAVIALVVGAAILSLSAGCATQDKESARTVTLSGAAVTDDTHSTREQIGGREVALSAAGGGEFSLQVDPVTHGGTVVLDDRKLVIEGDSVLYRGKEVMKLASESKNVDIVYKSGRATISDGVGPAKTIHQLGSRDEGRCAASGAGRKEVNRAVLPSSEGTVLRMT